MDENLLTTTNNPGSLAQPNTLEDKSTSDLVSSVFAPASTNQFSLDIPGTFTSDALAGDTTLSDVSDFRNTEEAKQIGAQTQIDEFDALLSRVSGDQEATAFSDPETFLNTMFLNRTPTEAETSQQDILDTSATRTSDFFGGIQGDISQAQEQFGVAGRSDELSITRNKLAERTKRMREDLRAFEVNAEERGVAREFVQDKKRKLEADAVAEIADLSIIESAQLGNLEEARGLAQDVIDEKYKAFEAENAQTSADLARLIPTLEGEAKDRAIQVQVALDERTRNLQAEKDKETAIREFAITAASEGADQATVSAIMNATSQDQAQLLASPFIGKLDRAAKSASIRASNASASLDEQKLLDIDAKQALIDAAVADGQIILSEDQADRASKLSKEFVTESGEFKKQVDAFNRIVASAEDPSAAGDVAVVFNFMKMLDPGSVVRESEFALAASTGSLEEAMKNKFGKVATGEILEFTREDFVDRAQKLYLQGLEQQVQLEENKRTQAIDLFGLPENAADLIIQDVRATGALSETVFGLTLNSMSDEQLAELAADGLITQ